MFVRPFLSFPLDTGWGSIAPYHADLHHHVDGETKWVRWFSIIIVRCFNSLRFTVKRTLSTSHTRVNCSWHTVHFHGKETDKHYQIRSFSLRNTLDFSAISTFWSRAWISDRVMDHSLHELHPAKIFGKSAFLEYTLLRGKVCRPP